jgi:hypothetical protein
VCVPESEVVSLSEFCVDLFFSGAVSAGDGSSFLLPIGFLSLLRSTTVVVSDWEMCVVVVGEAVCAGWSVQSVLWWGVSSCGEAWVVRVGWVSVLVAGVVVWSA